MKHRNVERVLPPDSDDAVKASIDQEKLCDGISTQTSAVEQSDNEPIPEDLKSMGSAARLRKYLGVLIHLLNHHACTPIPDGPNVVLECTKLSCWKESWILLHVHGCHKIGKCQESWLCEFVWKLLNHWCHCHSKRCGICGPWLVPHQLQNKALKFFRDIFVKSALPFAKLVEKLEEVRREYAQQGESSSESDDDENVNEKIAGEVRIMVPVLPVLVQPYHGGASVKKVPMHRRKVRKGLSTYRYRAKPKKIKSKAASDDEEDSDDADVVVKQVFPTLDIPTCSVTGLPLEQTSDGAPGRCCVHCNAYELRSSEQGSSEQ